MEQLTREAIETLESLHVPLEYEDVIKLEGLACKLKYRGLDADPASLTMSYHTIAGLKIYPLTLGAKLWLRRVYDLFDEDIIVTLAMIYALVHSCEPEKFTYTKWQIERELDEFGKNLKITDSDLKEIEEFVNKSASNVLNDISFLLQDLIEQIKNDPCNLNLVKINKFFDDNQSDKNNIEEQIVTVNILMHTIGESRDFWLWNCSEEYLKTSIQTAEDILSQGGNKSIGKSFAKDFIAFNGFVNQLKERVKE